MDAGQKTDRTPEQIVREVCNASSHAYESLCLSQEIVPF